MKKLDKLIIKAFIGPFIATFFVTVFVLVMQFFWLWIDDFVGKGLDAFTILKFIWYQSAALIPLALPLAVLLSSLMTFGNLGETFELVAIKSAGISLLRFMRPLFFVTAIISFGAFLFNNYVIPVANLKSRTLLTDIVLAKPAFDIKEGVFYDKLDGIAIKIGKKENDSLIHDVIAFEQNNSLQDNFVVAKSGIMKPSPDRRFLDFYLKKGTRYQERGNSTDSVTEYIRMAFSAYKKQFDISSFNFKASADSNNRDNASVYSMRQISVAVDSMQRFSKEEKERFKNSAWNGLPLLMYKDSTVKEKLPDTILNIRKNTAEFFGVKKYERQTAGRVADSIQKIFKKGLLARQKIKAEKKTVKKDSSVLKKDSVSRALAKQDTAGRHRSASDSQELATANTQKIDTSSHDSGKSSAEKYSDSVKYVKLLAAKAYKRNSRVFSAIIPDSARDAVNYRAETAINALKGSIDMWSQGIRDREREIRRYNIEWHRKISLAIACIVLFVIGAPLGSIIRKGGLGSPLIFAIVFFMIFYFVSTRGEKMAKEDAISTFTGMWLAVFVLLPIGIFLTYKAMHDSNLFSKEFYSRLRRYVMGWFASLKKNQK